MENAHEIDAILVVECEDEYRIIGPVVSFGEAEESANNYEETAGPGDDDTIPPDNFVIWKRNRDGRYAIRIEGSCDKTGWRFKEASL
jgi:hypothetical protein